MRVFVKSDKNDGFYAGFKMEFLIPFISLIRLEGTKGLGFNRGIKLSLFLRMLTELLG